MSERRYKVGVTTGYGGDGGPGAKWSAQAFVMDTANCHRLVGQTFESGDRWGKDKDGAIAKVRAQAEAMAELFERGPQTLGEHIYLARVSRGLSRQELATQAGVDDTAVWRWERAEKTPEPGTRARVVGILDLPAEFAL